MGMYFMSAWVLGHCAGRGGAGTNWQAAAAQQEHAQLAPAVCIPSLDFGVDQFFCIGALKSLFLLGGRKTSPGKKPSPSPGICSRVITLQDVLLRSYDTCSMLNAASLHVIEHGSSMSLILLTLMDDCFRMVNRAGSPLGLFLALRKVDPGKGRGLGTPAAAALMPGVPAGQGQGDGLPAVNRLYNLYHPFDPVGYRFRPPGFIPAPEPHTSDLPAASIPIFTLFRCKLCRPVWASPASPVHHVAPQHDTIERVRLTTWQTALCRAKHVCP